MGDDCQPPGPPPQFAAADSPQARELRLAMVRRQIEARGVSDERVLAAFRAVPRHAFCAPRTSLDAAYADHPLAIGQGQTISQPYMVATMTEWLAPGPDDRVLEIGTGSGYQAAILALLAGEVCTVERLPALAATARERLAALGLANVRIHEGDGTRGWPQDAPYNAILVTAAAPRIPEALLEQLADGGRLVIPVGGRDVQQVERVTRHGDRFDRRPGEGCRFVPLIGAFAWPE